MLMLSAAPRSSYSQYETKHLQELSEKLQPKEFPSKSFMINYRDMNDKRILILTFFIQSYYTHFHILCTHKYLHERVYYSVSFI
jgi:exonuclease V gamma subunit